jgi:hypothetical protein
LKELQPLKSKSPAQEKNKAMGFIPYLIKMRQMIRLGIIPTAFEGGENSGLQIRMAGILACFAVLGF